MDKRPAVKILRCDLDKARKLMLWQLHTLARAAEAANAQWCEIDLTKRLWTIPAERMKKRREHVVPLSHQMVSFRNSQ